MQTLWEDIHFYGKHSFFMCNKSNSILSAPITTENIHFFISTIIAIIKKKEKYKGVGGSLVQWLKNGLLTLRFGFKRGDNHFVHIMPKVRSLPDTILLETHHNSQTTPISRNHKQMDLGKGR